MEGIEISEGHKNKCPNCNTTYSIENEREVLYRNITLLHFNKKTMHGQVKCKQCKQMVKINT